MKIALYKGKRGGFAGAFDAAVRWWTRGPYSHVELVFSDGMAASSSTRDGGVRFKRIDFKPEHWDFVEIDGDECNAADWFGERLGAGYDYFGLFGFIWRPGSGVSRRWFCSEAVAAALGYRDPWRFCPNTLAAVVMARRLGD
jgi:hypothetical protein